MTIFLCWIALDIDREFDATPSTFQLSPRRSGIANFLGLTTETVSGPFTWLRRSKVVGIEQRWGIPIFDIDLLLDETPT